MTADTIITAEEIPVMYVAGQRGRPIAEQAPKAFEKLEAKLPSLKGRKRASIGSVLRSKSSVEGPTSTRRDHASSITEVGRSSC